jgi:hypothetical protein
MTDPTKTERARRAAEQKAQRLKLALQANLRRRKASEIAPVEKLATDPDTKGV